MSRIRSVHPGLWTDEDFVTMSLAARLFLIGIWNEADDYGLFDWKPLKLKMRLAPADNVDAAAILLELVNAGFVVRLSRGGRDLGVVRNFRKFQRPQKPGKPLVPVDDHIRLIINLDGSGTGQGSVDDHSSTPTGIPPQMEDGGWNRKEELESVVVVPAATPTTFSPDDNDDDEIFAKVSEALGQKAKPNVCAQIARIVRPLISDGYDLERDVLAELREVRAKSSGEIRGGALNWIVPQIRDRRDGRLASQKGRRGDLERTRFFVMRDTPQWLAWVKAGHKPGLGNARGDHKGRTVEGWYFDTEWPPAATAEVIRLQQTG